MAKKIKPMKVRDRPPTTMMAVNFCPVCSTELNKKQTGFCLRCKQNVIAALKGNRAVVYCRRGDHYSDLDRSKHGLEVTVQALRVADGKISLVVYDEDPGCPACAGELTMDQPHAIVKRLPHPNPEPKIA